MQPGDLNHPAVQFEDVSLRFGETVALDHVSFAIHPGETCVIFGAAGAGKTVMLKVALGLVRPDSGSVLLFGENVADLPEARLFQLRARVGILFQEGALFDSMTIAENVEYPLLNQHSLYAFAASQSQDSAQSTEDRVKEVLHFVELDKTLDKFPSELSGGMRRRVGIARAIVTRPALLLYDSPTAGLDPITAHTIIALILKERDLRNTATIMVTHRYQDGQLMANFRYNPNSGEIEHVSKQPRGPDEAAGAGVSTIFLVMNHGQLVFKGSQTELEASQDEYVRKFLRPGAS